VYIFWYVLLWICYSAFLPENEVDGSTLLKLTETMVARLLPKMKMQVTFMELQKSLQQTSLQVEIPVSASVASPNGNTVIVTPQRPSASEQNGSVGCYVWNCYWLCECTFNSGKNELCYNIIYTAVYSVISNYMTLLLFLKSEKTTT
jgi:hypothetical protein